MNPLEEPPRPMRADAERNIDAILNSALTTLADDPSASMEDVARAAGVTRTTVYRRFPNRETLIGALYERASVESLAALTEAEAAADDRNPVETLRAVVKAIAAVGDRYRFFATVSDDLALGAA